MPNIFMRQSSSPAVSGPNTCMFLDFGADAHRGQPAMEISRRGMHFNCRWHFEVGTLLSFSIQPPGGQILRITGFVVQCSRLGPELHRIGLLFEEVTHHQRRALRNISKTKKAAHVRAAESARISKSPGQKSGNS